MGMTKAREEASKFSGRSNSMLLISSSLLELYFVINVWKDVGIVTSYLRVMLEFSTKYVRNQGSPSEQSASDAIRC